MSADNGYIVRVHPKGGFCLVGYSMSCQMEDMYETPDGYPLADGREEQFPSIQAALNVDQSDPFGDGYWSEYGISLDDEVKNIQSVLLSELHEVTAIMPLNELSSCTCGYSPPNDRVPMLSLYQHQANALREQLKQLGG